VGTGQSLSVGTTPASSTTQPYNNLKLSLGTATVPGTGANPWDPTIAGLTMVPLVEPFRALETAYPSPYPGNIYGETPHAAMANQLTALVKAASPSSDYVTVHTVVGESGQGIVAINKQTGSTTGTTGRGYAATLFEVGAIARLAKAAGKSYGVGVVVMTHGETDCSSTTYKDQLVQLMSDYNTDIAAITGQTRKIPMYLSQQHGCPGAPACTKSSDLRPIANVTEWQLGVDHKGDFVCTGPKYQYPAHSDGDGIHLNVTGYQLLGEKTAQIYYQRAVLGQDWQPLQPTSVEHSGRVVTVHFHVPVPPLNWDTSLDNPKITEWVNGKGFELRTASANITIASVAIAGNDVQITASSDLPATGVTVGYALTNQGKQMSTASKSVRWGQLRDSDPFMGTTTNKPNPNYCVSFEMPVD
jgi:lysophospholipase L1-like esterase